MTFAYPVGVGEQAVGAQAIQEMPAPARAAHMSVRPQYFWIAAALIVLGGLLLRVWNLGQASLWTDEVMTALRAEVPFNQSVQSILSSGNQTPFYFLSLRLLPATTDVLLRLPSAVLGVVGIILLMAVTIRLYRDYRLALWMGALLAANPYHIWLSRTARPYALMFVLSLVVSCCFLQLMRGRRGVGLWWGLLLGSLVAYLTHYTAVALLAAQYGVFVLVVRNSRALFRRWLGAQALSLLPLLTWVYLLSRQSLEVASEWIPHPRLADIPLTLWSMTLGYKGVPEWYLVPGLMVVMIGLVFGALEALRYYRRNYENLYWLLLVVGPLVPTFILSAFFVSIYVDRYFMVFLPGLLYLIVLGWQRMARQHWQVALIVIITTGMYITLFDFYTGDFQRTDWRGAAQYVAREYRPGDALITERDNEQQAFLRYFDAARYPAAWLVIKGAPDTAAFEANARRIWVIYRNPNEDVHRQGAMPEFNAYQPGLTTVGDWLIERRDQVVSLRKFTGVTVILLDLTPP